MAISLAITDNADGTATATISGSAGGTVTVYSQAHSGELGTGTWTSRGSRTGNGTISITLAAGYYWWKAVESSDVAPLVYQNLTDGTEAVWYRCLTGVQAVIQGLSLTGISSGQVYVRKVPWDRDITKPGIIVCPVKETSDPKAGTNERDDIGYGVHVVLIRASNQDAEVNLALHLKQREQISRALRHQPLAGVSEIYTVFIEPGPVIDPVSFAQQYDVQALVARCISREVRGN